LLPFASVSAHRDLVAADGIEEGRPDWAERRIEQLLDLLDSEDSAARRVAILQEITRLYEQQLGDPVRAYVTAVAAFDEDVTFAPLIEQVARLAEACGDWDSFLDQQRRAASADESADPYTAAGRWLAIASWQAQWRGNVGAAIDAASRAAHVAPGEPAALATLAELLAHAERWDELVEVLARQAALHDDPAAAAQAWVSLGQICEGKLEDVPRAIAAHRNALELQPDCETAVDELERLARASGSLRDLAEILRQRASLSQEPAQRNLLLFDAACLYREELREPAAANAVCALIDDWGQVVEGLEVRLVTLERAADRARCYLHIGQVCWRELCDERRGEHALQQALAVSRDAPEAMIELATLYERRTDWRKAADLLAEAADLLAEAAPLVSHVGQRAELVMRQAQLLEHHLNDRPGAVRCYRQIADFAPEHHDAFAQLARLLYESESWAELEPVLHHLMAIADSAEDLGGRGRLLCRAAQCAEALGKYPDAVRAYQQALLLGCHDLEVMRGIADAYFACEHWSDAADAYAQLLHVHAGRLPPATAARVGARQAVAELRRGQADRALTIASEALAAAPSNPELLQTLAQVHASRGQWQKAAQITRRWADSESPARRVPVLRSLAQMYREQLDQPKAAAAALDEALEHSPDDRALLHALLDVTSHLGRWDRTVTLIASLALLEVHPVRRGKYHLAAAVIHRDKRAAPDQAVLAYEAALDALFEDPSLLSEADLRRALDAFCAVDAILTEQRDWAGQERAYRRMLRRHPPRGPAALALWDSLAEVYRSRLHRLDAAIAALEVADALDPGNLQRKRTLAELCIQAGPDQRDRAIELHQRILDHDPLAHGSYETLVRLYREADQPDAAWCAARVAVFLNQASAESRHFWAQLGAGPSVCRRRFTAETWALLYPKEADRLITAIFSLVSASAVLPRAKTVDRRPLLAIRSAPADTSRLVDALHRTAAVLGEPVPAVHYCKRQASFFEIVTVIPADKRVIGRSATVLVAGPDALVALPKSEVEFECARAIAAMRPDQLVRSTYASNRELAAVLDGAAAISCGRPATSPQPLAEHVMAALKAGLTPGQAEQLFALIRMFLRRTELADLAAWRDAMVRTTDRAALVACGDLAAAASVLQVRSGTDLCSNHRLADLLRYSVSDNHVAVRRELGVSLR
jgi:cellulose synthase operon protein C